MKNNKYLNSLMSIGLFTWIIFLGLLVVTLYFGYQGSLSYWWAIIPIFLLGVIFNDRFIQTKRSLLINYPLLARFRYIFESVRPEFRQYFFEGELDGKPFNRRQRSIVYQRSKNEKQTISFGMQDDPERIGYEWMAHTIYPKKTTSENFRIIVGNEQCAQPYSMSVLNVSAMSFGSLSKTAIESLNAGAMKGRFAHNTGEGGISDYHLKGADLVWQIGTGYFGCRDEKGNFSSELFAEKAMLPNVKMIEIKVSQGAKPGHGGLLPAEKNTPEIAQVRHIEPYTTVHSSPTHSVFSDAKGLLTFVDQLRKLSKGKPVGFKICIGRKSEFIDIIDYILSMNIIPDFITIDGAEGGTGAAPLEFIDNFGMSLSDSLAFVALELYKHNLKDRIKIIASGKIITAFDIAKALALGADACNSARGMMFSLGCIQALKCDNGKCPVGIATQDPDLYKGLDLTNKSERVANYHKNTLKALAELMGACGAEDLNDIKPEFFYKRTAYNNNVSFEDVYFRNRM